MVVMLSPAISMSLDGEYECNIDDDEIPDDVSDIPLEGILLSLLQVLDSSCIQVLSQKQLYPHRLPHTVQNVNSQSHSMQSRRLRYSPHLY